MNFRVSVTQLRVLLLVGNLVLAMAVFATASWNMVRPREPEAPVKVESRAKFAYTPLRIPTVGSPARKMRTVAERLQPQPPKELDPPGGGEDGLAGEDPDEEETPEPLEGGPLEGKFEFVFCIVDHVEPLNTLVRLQKTGTDKNPRAGRGRNSRARQRRATAQRRGGSRSSRARGAKTRPSDNVVSFLVGDRKFEVPDPEGVFYVDKADTKHFVYWAYDEGPEKMYSLELVEETPYGQDPEKGIRPEEEDEEDGKEGDEEEKEKKYFISRPYDYKKDVEDQYRAIMLGKLQPKDAKLINENQMPKFSEKKPASPTAKGPKPSTTAAKRGTSFKKPTTSNPPAGGSDAAATDAQGSASKPMTKEEGMAEIGGILEQAEKDGKISSDKDREDVQKLKEMLGRPKKKNPYVEPPGE